jgi:hypothetical protein
MKESSMKESSEFRVQRFRVLVSDLWYSRETTNPKPGTLNSEL